MPTFEPDGQTRRAFIRSAAAAALGARLAPPALADDAPGEMLYNGIRLPRPWPPERTSLPSHPVLPPYLADPPDVIPIDLGRQLFVDDFLIEQTSLERSFHHPDYFAGNPIISPTTEWEKRDEYADRTRTHANPTAMVFSDGVFYDPADRLFKMWYMGGYAHHTCYATSHDGVRWTKPPLPVVAGTNIVLSEHRDSSTVWLDPAPRSPAERFKMTISADDRLTLFLSPDGIRWRRAGESGPAGDRTTFFLNPFRRVWVFSLRDHRQGHARSRRYVESPDFVAGAHWRASQPVVWVGTDADDPLRRDYGVPTELYNLDCVAYESVLLGLFTIFRGERNDREKPNDLCIGFSRDGFHWHRPDRTAFLPVSEHAGDWNWANVQSAGGCCLVVGDRLHFYVSGRQGVPGTSYPGVCSTGLATLRRDGFASMGDPVTSAVQRTNPDVPPGTLITRPLRFTGRHLFVNVDCPNGRLRVEVLDREGRVIAPFVMATSRPIQADSTCARAAWSGADDLSALAGRPVRFRFHLERGRLYAFWVSRSPTGASGGYVAAGGPGFGGPTDAAGGGA